MLKLGLFRDRRFSVAAAGELLGAFGLLGGLFLQTQVLQFDLGYSPLQAGLRILPVAALLVLSVPLSPSLARLVGVKLTVTSGLAAIGIGLCWNSAVSSVGRRTSTSFVPACCSSDSEPVCSSRRPRTRLWSRPPGRLRHRVGFDLSCCRWVEHSAWP